MLLADLLQAAGERSWRQLRVAQSVPRKEDEAPVQLDGEFLSGQTQVSGGEAGYGLPLRLTDGRPRYTRIKVGPTIATR